MILNTQTIVSIVATSTLSLRVDFLTLLPSHTLRIQKILLIIMISLSKSVLFILVFKCNGGLMDWTSYHVPQTSLPTLFLGTTVLKLLQANIPIFTSPQTLITTSATHWTSSLQSRVFWKQLSSVYIHTWSSSPPIKNANITIPFPSFIISSPFFNY